MGLVKQASLRMVAKEGGTCHCWAAQAKGVGQAAAGDTEMRPCGVVGIEAWVCIQTDLGILQLGDPHKHATGCSHLDAMCGRRVRLSACMYPHMLSLCSHFSSSSTNILMLVVEHTGMSWWSELTVGSMRLTIRNNYCMRCIAIHPCICADGNREQQASSRQLCQDTLTQTGHAEGKPNNTDKYSCT